MQLRQARQSKAMGNSDESRQNPLEGDEKYEAVKRLGEGAFGQVWLARNRSCRFDAQNCSSTLKEDQ